MIHTGDCVEVMAGMEAESFDAVVTDPPAGIGFMGKSWDHHRGGRDEWVAWMTVVMKECLRVLKPGGHALVWALPRTSYWTAWALDDAGFEVRDRIAHIFASGFPKSHNLPGGLGTALKPAVEDWWLARKPLQGTVASNVQRYGTGALNIDATRIGTTNDDEGRPNRFVGINAQRVAMNAAEDGSLADGVAMTSQGRWPPNLLLSDAALFDIRNDGVVGSGAVATSGLMMPTVPNSTRTVYGQDAEAGYTTMQTYGDTGGYSRFFLVPHYEQAAEADDREASAPILTGELSSAAADYPRVFLVPKASRSDREPVWGEELAEGMVGGRSRNDGRQWDIPGSTLDNGKPRRRNTHPTAKPVDLMRHLVRLVTPPGGRILDPFLGSGTTAIAAIMEGFECVGIEREPEYVAIAEARLNGVQQGAGL